ncbi:MULTISPECIES: IclR family transcriptional regulator [unclassified Corynebacterium]|uniref:IclR family transcriptional regulator n=1 Tax=unclassified Corynebacterium TaxID=2624378 RepID=UPI0029C9D243|nr:MULTISPECIES: IclR family transcriptional regulator [unclassified Corynebacterium]WPF67074.1 IclR family transcriptional regulator [Corynebacterium sp. 22KM0430]WPF69562.1 IclR family transcriptional regulator [Corynebacterium sp. 21KM1197]
MGHYDASGIKVLDRAVSIMVTVAHQPRSLTELCEATELPRATAHRLATALEAHRILARTSEGKWTIGPTLTTIGARSKNQLIDAATPTMTALMERTGESVQLYQLTGTSRTCIAALEPSSGLQNTVPIGSRMPLTAGSAAKVFLAYASPDLRDSILPQASFDAAALSEVRERGWADSIGEREVGLSSLSAPISNSAGEFLAVLSLSGVSERLRPSPGELWGAAILDSARHLSQAL